LETPAVEEQTPELVHSVINLRSCVGAGGTSSIPKVLIRAKKMRDF